MELTSPHEVLTGPVGQSAQLAFPPRSRGEKRDTGVGGC